MHHYTRFEETALDTILFRFHKDYNPVYAEGFGYESLGIIGHAANYIDFLKRRGSTTFFFANGWNPYLQTPDREVFFNTKKPFTEIAYSLIPVVDWKEETIRVLHTQNVTPFSNVGLKFNILSGKQLYANEDTRSNRISLFGSHARNRYSVFGTFQYNDFRAEDHGGLKKLSGFLKDSLETLWSYPMNLDDAASQYRNWSVFMTHKYNISESKTTTDSAGITSRSGKTLSLAYQLHLTRDLKTFTDNVNPQFLPSLFDTLYYPLNEVKDSVSADRISNLFQLILGDPYKDRISARAFAGYDLHRYSHLYPDRNRYLSRVDTLSEMPVIIDSVFRDTVVADLNRKIFHNVYAGFHLAGPTGGVWDWTLDARYYLTGYYSRNFNVTGTFSRELAQSVTLGFSALFASERPHFFMKKYSSAFFRWDNEFDSELKAKGEIYILSREKRMDLRINAGYINRYVYWDQDALPVQYDKSLLILSGSFQKHFIVSGFNSDNRILLQYTPASEVLRLPLAAIHTSNFWKQVLFKGALIFHAGFDLYYTTPYAGNSYMPATGVFYLQDNSKTGGYPFLDLFLDWRIKRTRFFLTWNNVLSGPILLGNNFFSTYGYPMKPRNIRFGLAWTFYD